MNNNDNIEQLARERKDLETLLRTQLSAYSLYLNDEFQRTEWIDEMLMFFTKQLKGSSEKATQTD